MTARARVAPLLVALQLPWPPSVNRYWRHWKGRTLLSRDGRSYRKAAKARRHPGVKPLDGRLAVRLVLCPPDRRRRDIDNSLKAVLDALGHAGVYKDDSQIDILEVWRGAVEKDGSVLVLIGHAAEWRRP